MPPMQPMQPVQVPQPQMPYKPTNHRSFLLPFIVSVCVLIAIASFAIWAFMGRQDYKNNADAKAAAVAKAAVEQAEAKKDVEFAEASKNPAVTYHGPSDYGSVSFNYPKTYSAYVINKAAGGMPVNAYFHPSTIHDVASSTPFALRMQIVDKRFADVQKSFAGKVKSGKLKVSAYKVERVPDAKAIKVVGEINTGQNDTMVVVEVRDKTLQIWTEVDTFVKDFEEFALKSLTFVP